MNEWIALIIGLAAGAAAAGVIALIRRGPTQREIAGLSARAEHLETRAGDLIQENETLRAESRGQSLAREEADRRAAVLEEKFQAKQQQFDEQKRLLEEAERKLTDVFRSAGAEALRANNEQFIALAKKAFDILLAEAKGDVDKKQQAIDGLLRPIRDLMELQNRKLIEFDRQWSGEKSSLEEHLRLIAQAHDRLGSETNRLVTALRRPEIRGRWGEIQLRNVVEMAGMTEHCDFLEQVQTDDPSTRDRPDMVVKLPGRGVIPVDAKVALDAYLDAVQPDADRAVLLQRHARQVEQHVSRLSSKAYWKQFDRSPQVVVLFMPLESALSAALEVKPDLHAEAMQQHILIATPTLLVAMLRAIAYGWQQEAIAQNARQIAEVGRELYDRLGVFAGHLERVGRGLDNATKSYNQAIGSLETRVLVSARRLRELRATTAAEIDGPPPIEIDPREITAPEFRAPPEE